MNISMISDDILKSFEEQNVLVTGGSGMIGRFIVQILEEAGARIRIASLDTFKVSNKAEQLKLDLTRFDNCTEAVKDMDFVFHLAGVTASDKSTLEKPASCFVPMVMMNTNLLEAARLEGVGKLLYTSSIGAYAKADYLNESNDNNLPPMDLYPGLAKRVGETQVGAYCTEFGLTNFAMVRPANVYGPGDHFYAPYAMLIPAVLTRMHRGENPVLVWGDGSPVRDFVYSQDVAEGMILALYHGTAGKFVNLGSGVGSSVADVVAYLHKIADFKSKFDTSYPSIKTKRVMDISLSQKLIGYNPKVTLEDGLSRTWKWLMEHPSEHEGKKRYY